LRIGDAAALCGAHTFPVQGGIPRLLPPDLLEAANRPAQDDLRARTYRSFGFEWKHFSEQLPVYGQNFLWYLEPLPGIPLKGRLVLDAGCGMGRHTHHFLKAEARVLAVDASPAVEIAARNNPQGEALFVQADIMHLPVEADCFDLVSCLGVLHHMEDTKQGLDQLIRAVRPGGWVLLYVYHNPSETSRWRGALLSLVTLARRLTTRMPFRPLWYLTWVLSVCLYLSYVGPAKVLSLIPAFRSRLRGLPLGWYIECPFRALWTDQFDRFSAPLEKRYTRAQVQSLVLEAGLQDIRILGGFGWRVAARRPAAA
jgi:SAM-dependent methyltransferase